MLGLQVELLVEIVCEIGVSSTEKKTSQRRLFPQTTNRILSQQQQEQQALEESLSAVSVLF
jgi:hypothetical protein